jgi:hypothetical protein
MSEIPRQEHSEPPPATDRGADQRREATPEDFENDPARNPDDETLKDIKGG